MLNETVDVLSGVGEKMKNELAQLDIYTIKDLLFYFPFRYDFLEIKPLSELIHNESVTIVGTVVHPPMITSFGRKRTRLMFNVQVDHASVKAVMFNRTYAKKHLQKGVTVTLTGKWDAHRLQITVNHFQVGQPKTKQKIRAVYSVKGSITNARLSRIVTQALDRYGDQVEEILPASYLQNYKLPSRKHAVKMLHLPENKLKLKHARRRIIFEELLLFQLKINKLKKQNRDARQGTAHRVDNDKIISFVNRLPFTLTEAQQKSLYEIIEDLKSPIQMYRLLQGDVGSGKTAVATVCLYATVTSGAQGALMVPTEILAEQHVKTIRELIGDEMNVALLTSSVKGKERKTILADIANNHVQIVIGTHSLIQEEVVFYHLGLIIIDEQHRFGVGQRRMLREKGLHPDVLFMTATPIPRTLAITAFGDMDISIINEMPKGRKQVETYWIKDNLLDRVLRFIEKKVLLGEQAYIVSPLIEESETFDYQNAIDLYQQLLAFYPAHVKVGLLHGRLSNEDKEIVMKQFINNQIHILVATTVIEVGVNVPNATIMVIYDAERFGLSQLHQLRGRVGRGEKQSYCILIADPKGDVGKERMRIMTETNDGFKLAEEDLKLRGPGDFFGKKQSGLPEFKVADLVHDFRALEVARKDAEYIIFNNLLQTDETFRTLKKELENEAFERFD